jgi:hypothetical protein
MWDKDDDSECGCGGVCKWNGLTKEEKIAHLEKKEAKFEKMLAHVKKVKEAVASGKEMKPENDKE